MVPVLYGLHHLGKSERVKSSRYASRHMRTTLLPLVALTLIYWGVAAALAPSNGVAGLAWLMLYGACIAGAMAVWRFDLFRLPPGKWLVAAALAGLLAAILWGANIGLDALHGSSRVKVNVASSLGGLELWLVLCPGIVSIALASSLRGVIARRSSSRLHSAPREHD